MLEPLILPMVLPLEFKMELPSTYPIVEPELFVIETRLNDFTNPSVSNKTLGNKNPPF